MKPGIFRYNFVPESYVLSIVHEGTGGFTKVS